jgi:hypothetical protein
VTHAKTCWRLQRISAEKRESGSCVRNPARLTQPLLGVVTAGMTKRHGVEFTLFAGPGNTFRLTAKPEPIPMAGQIPRPGHFGWSDRNAEILEDPHAGGKNLHLP